MNDNSSYSRIIGKEKISDAYYLAESRVYPFPIPLLSFKLHPSPTISVYIF